jgi:hypothetical protein
MQSHFYILALDSTLLFLNRKTTKEGVPYNNSLPIAIKHDPVKQLTQIGIFANISHASTVAFQLQADTLLSGEVWYTAVFPIPTPGLYPWGTDPAGLPGLTKWV